MKMKASAGKREKDDCLVTVSQADGTMPALVINSSVRSLFAASQNHIAIVTLEEMDAGKLKVEIDDYQALDFVLAARIRAAVLRFHNPKLQ